MGRDAPKHQNEKIGRRKSVVECVMNNVSCYWIYEKSGVKIPTSFRTGISQEDKQTQFKHASPTPLLLPPLPNSGFSFLSQSFYMQLLLSVGLIKIDPLVSK